MKICYIGIGSNLGDRRKNIKIAVEKIKELKDTQVIKVSKIFETEPVGGPVAQEKYLNGALKISTALAPKALLKGLQRIEIELGRKKTVRNAPRVIDLDILFYADRIIRTKDLIVPHPRLFEREFVLKPLGQII